MPLGIGQTIAGKYRIDAAIGEGGFGAVFRATTHNSGREVAIKVLKPGNDGQDVARATRFLREMRAIGKLESPYTLTLFDFGKTVDGLLFMVTEHIAGRDLLELMNERERLSEAEVAHIMMQVLLSLSEAHRHSLLHRDIKPSNIRIFSYGGDSLRVKVLDFGLALSLDSDEQRLTGTGRSIGTPRYMAPEQHLGDPLGPQTDIFSLGLVAYDALLGRTARSATTFLPEISKDDPVGAALANVVNMMLARDLADRPSAADVVAALRPIQPTLATRVIDVPAAPAGPQDSGNLELDWQVVEKPASRPMAPPVHAHAYPQPGPAPPSETKPPSASTGIGMVFLVGAIAFVTVAALIRVVSGGPPEEAVNEPPRAMVEAVPDAGPDVGTRITVRGGSAGCGRRPMISAGLMTTRFNAYERQIPVALPADYDGSVALPLVLFVDRKRDKRHDPPLTAQETAPSFAKLATEKQFVFAVVEHGGHIPGRLDAIKHALCVETDRVHLVVKDDDPRKHACVDGIHSIAATGFLQSWSHMPKSIIEAKNKAAAESECSTPIPLFLASELLAPTTNYAGDRGCEPISDFEDIQKAKIERQVKWMKRNQCKTTNAVEKSYGERNHICTYFDCESPYQHCDIIGGGGWAHDPPADVALFKVDPTRAKPGSVFVRGEPVNGYPNRCDVTEFPYAEAMWDFFDLLAKTEDKQAANGSDIDAGHVPDADSL